jgi:hypothetical protein
MANRRQQEHTLDVASAAQCRTPDPATAAVQHSPCNAHVLLSCALLRLDQAGCTVHAHDQVARHLQTGRDERTHGMVSSRAKVNRKEDSAESFAGTTLR